MEAWCELRGAGYIIQGRLCAERSRKRAHLYLGPDHWELPVDAERPRGAGHQPKTRPCRGYIRVAGYPHPRPNDQTMERGLG